MSEYIISGVRMCCETKAALPLLAVLMLPATVCAASLPGAGTLGNQAKQTVPVTSFIPFPSEPELSLPETSGRTAPVTADNGVRFLLKEVRLTGDLPKGVSRKDTDRLIQSRTGKLVSFTDVREIASGLTALYRERGFLLARVIVPRQTITDGVLSLQVIPGKFSTSTVTGDLSVKTGVVSRLLRAGAPEGKIITRGELERLSLLINETPGLHGDVVLTQGRESGTASVNVRARRDRSLTGYLGMDNMGSQVTGKSRVLGGVAVTGLAGQGDLLRLDGAVSYEDGGLTNVSADYSLLATGYGTRAGVNASRLDYRYDFSGYTFRGYADSWSVYATHPLVRNSRVQVDIRASAGQSFLTDGYPDIYSFIADRGKKTANTATLGAAGSALSVPGGVTGAGLKVTFGDMHYRDYGARFWSGSDIRNTEGHFTTLNWQASHEQQIAGPLSAFVLAHGQLTDKNLDASQKFLLGGPSAVRAGNVGDGAVDTGTVLTAELRTRWQLPSMKWLSSPYVTVAGFYDYGEGDQNRNNRVSGVTLAENNHVKLGGAGMYATVGDTGNWSATATWAHNTTGKDPVSGHHDSDIFWLSAVKTF